jgi:hypothetical protein
VVAGSSPAESANKGKEMIKLELTLDEINYVLKSVGKNPYEECAPLVSKIHAQAVPQVEALKAQAPEEAQPESVE